MEGYRFDELSLRNVWDNELPWLLYLVETYADYQVHNELTGWYDKMFASLT